MTKRDQLGEAFGTRKAKSRIRANERNKVDASAQESVREHLMQYIDDAAVSMPSEGRSNEAVTSSDILEATDSASHCNAISPLIPLPNMSTSDPSKVYPLDVLIPLEEASAIDVKSLLDKTLSDRERMNMLPFRASRWIEQKMRMSLELPSEDKLILLGTPHRRALYYISCMRQFQKMKGALANLSSLPEKMNHVPTVILDGFVQRFTEQARGSAKPVITPAMENKLMAYQFAIRLAVENWAADIDATASDLQLTSQRVTDIYKSLGCTVDKVSVSDRERLGIKSGEARNMTKAILQAPPVFPRERKRGPAKR
ncbi:hypothetical protein QFC19_006303 [Naganishia cerealis]|uniref:Uncharacterized protein n=1 Tax=Naganishia cerealis TaxID=610337 RepID=A0ACC2VI16_9TREE|nr:hypothetical protein QFC19_006303 [Naganishia cerealis]